MNQFATMMMEKQKEEEEEKTPDCSYHYDQAVVEQKEECDLWRAILRIDRTEAQEIASAADQRLTILRKSLVDYNAAYKRARRIRQPEACHEHLRQGQAARRDAYNRAREDYDIAVEWIRKTAHRARQQAVQETNACKRSTCVVCVQQWKHAIPVVPERNQKNHDEEDSLERSLKRYQQSVEKQKLGADVIMSKAPSTDTTKRGATRCRSQQRKCLHARPSQDAQRNVNSNNNPTSQQSTHENIDPPTIQENRQSTSNTALPASSANERPIRRFLSRSRQLISRFRRRSASNGLEQVHVAHVAAEALEDRTTAEVGCGEAVQCPTLQETSHDRVAPVVGHECAICLENSSICIALPCRHLVYCVSCARSVCVNVQGEPMNCGDVTCAECGVPVQSISRVFMDAQCVVCLDEPPCVVFLPCLHMSCCHDCTKSVQTARRGRSRKANCAKCREEIQEVAQILPDGSSN